MSDTTIGDLEPAPSLKAGLKNGPLAPLLAPLLAGREAWLSIHENERAIAFAGTRGGGIVIALALLACLAAGLQLSTAALGLVGVTLIGMVLLPAHAISIMLGASLFYFALRPFRIEGWADLVRERAVDVPTGQALALQGAAVAIVLALSLGFLFWQRRFAHVTAAKRPVMTLILAWFTLLGFAILAPVGSMLDALAWSVVGVAISSLWILAYSAIDARSKSAAPAWQRGLFLRPFWGGSAAPIGKSFGYLNRFAPRHEDDLAITRLKALKLAVWALVLTGLLWLARWAA